MVTPSAVASQFGTFSVRTGPPPREISWNETVALGGELAGMKISAPWMNGSWLRTGSGWLRSVWPSRLRSKAKNALTCLLMGQRTSVQTLRSLISSWSFSAPWAPHSSLYLIMTADTLPWLSHAYYSIEGEASRRTV